MWGVAYNSFLAPDATLYNCFYNEIYFYILMHVCTALVKGKLKKFKLKKHPDPIHPFQEKKWLVDASLWPLLFLFSSSFSNDRHDTRDHPIFDSGHCRLVSIYTYIALNFFHVFFKFSVITNIRPTYEYEQAGSSLPTELKLTVLTPFVTRNKQ